MTVDEWVARRAAPPEPRYRPVGEDARTGVCYLDTLSSARKLLELCNGGWTASRAGGGKYRVVFSPRLARERWEDLRSRLSHPPLFDHASSFDGWRQLEEEFIVNLDRNKVTWVPRE
jgi:hypothetical protein